jgi:hypothetical protein
MYGYARPATAMAAHYAVSQTHLTVLIAMLKTGQPYGPKRRSATGAAPSGT